MRCFACQGPFSEVTGHFFAPDVPYCGRCIRIFYQWMKGHTNRRWSGASFYEEAATSVRAGVWPTKAEERT